MIEFAKKIKKIQEKARVALKKVQKKIKRQADKRRKEAEVWKKNNKVIYIIEKIIFSNTVKLRLCHILNSKTYLRHIQLQYNIKSLWLFGLICVQNSVGSLILYNRLNSIKFLWIFGFIWVKIHIYLYLFPLSKYFLSTLQNYSDFIWSFLLSNLNSYLVFHYWNIHSEILSQIRYSLVVILELNGVSEVQYKDVMMVDDGKYQ